MLEKRKDKLKSVVPSLAFGTFSKENKVNENERKKPIWLWKVSSTRALDQLMTKPEKNVGIKLSEKIFNFNLEKLTKVCKNK